MGEWRNLGKEIQALWKEAEGVLLVQRAFRSAPHITESPEKMKNHVIFVIVVKLLSRV